MSCLQFTPTRDLRVCLSLEIGSLRVSVVKRKSYWRRAALNSVTRVLEEGGEDRDPGGKPRDGRGRDESNVRTSPPHPGERQSRGEAQDGAALTSCRWGELPLCHPGPARWPPQGAEAQGWREGALTLLSLSVVSSSLRPHEL